jgi:hypothetical protein
MPGLFQNGKNIKTEFPFPSPQPTLPFTPNIKSARALRQRGKPFFQFSS